MILVIPNVQISKVYKSLLLHVWTLMKFSFVKKNKGGRKSSAQPLMEPDSSSPHCPPSVTLLFRLHFKPESAELLFRLSISQWLPQSGISATFWVFLGLSQIPLSMRKLSLLMVKLEFSLKGEAGNFYESFLVIFVLSDWLRLFHMIKRDNLSQ